MLNQSTFLPPDLPAWRRSAADELVNALTHALGLVLAVIGALVMASGLLALGDVRLAAGCAVYLASLIAVYAMSTLSHSAWSPKWKSLFRRLDQGFIYLLIVATYTPLSLFYLRGSFWSAVLAAMWIAAIIGFVAKVFFAHRTDAVSVVSYLALGWAPALAVPELISAVPAAALWSMFLGGLCYTVGTLFLTYDERVRHFHAAWHLCVIAGSACHFVGILVFVVGGAGAGIQ
ncbi:MAG TPA: hemolysin III family protein [Lacipirellulaceae bacterium]|jgi:hemolysin III|nr:hemolysin III family protein [Lacipirellulaceae bacterium]